MTCATASRRGYALILCLLLSMLVGLSLLASTRLSLRLASEAVQAERQLQFEAATGSCNRTFATVGPAWLSEVLIDRAVDGREVLPSVETRITLSGVPYRIAYCDEQGKLNAAALLRSQGPDKAASRLRELLPHSRLASRLKRTALNDRQTALPELFEGAEPDELMRVSVPQRAVEGAITTWGNGKLCLRTATDRTLRTALVDAVSGVAIERLLTARHDRPSGGLANWMERAELTDVERSAVGSIATDQSRVDSVWVVADLPGRAGYGLSVWEYPPDGKLRVTWFEW